MSPQRFLVLLLIGGLSTATAGNIKCKVELGLVVDTTKSIGFQNIPKLKGFLRQLVQRFEISKDGTHVSLETFDKESTLHNKFNNDDYYSQKAVLELIEENISKQSQPTRLDKALNLADEEMFVHGNGERAGVRSVMVLFSDGKSHPRLTVKEDYTRRVASLQGKGVRIVAVGIGNFAKKKKFRDVLRLIAGDNVFFVDDYDILDSKGAVDDTVKIICPPAVCENSVGLDAAFLVDRTQSIGKENFLLLKGFLLQIFDALDISPNATHTGIIVFDKKAQVLNRFSDSDFHSTKAIHNLIEEIPDKLGSPTRIDKALEAALEELFTVEGGDRPRFRNVLVLLTDGRTNPASTPYNEIIPLLKEKNVRLVAVGVGRNIFEKELEEIAGNNTHVVNSFSDLPDWFATILNETCSVDGGFSRWSFWSKCSVTCGVGVETRTRNCTHPKPQGFGKDCVGHSTEKRTCPKGPCSEGQHKIFDSRFRAGRLDELKRELSEPLRPRFVEESFPRRNDKDVKQDKGKK